MSIPYICFSCRRSLHRRALSRRAAAQWLTNAISRAVSTSPSLVNIVPPANDKQLLPKQETRKKPPQHHAPVNIRLDELFLNKASLEKAGRYSGKSSVLRSEKEMSSQFFENPRPADRRTVGPSVESADGRTQAKRHRVTVSKEHSNWVYNEVTARLEHNGASEGSEVNSHVSIERMSNRNARQATTITIYPEGDSPASKLRALLDGKSGNGLEIWSLFQKHYPSLDCPSLSRPVFQDRAVMSGGQLFSEFLHRMTTEWLDTQDPNLPMPFQIIRKLESLNLMRPEGYARVIWRLLVPGLRGLARDERSTSTSITLEQVVFIWADLFQCFTKDSMRDPESEQSGSVDWTGLPENLKGTVPVEPMLQDSNVPLTEPEQTIYGRLGPQGKDIGFRLFHVLDKMPSTVRNSLAASALATFSLMNRVDDIDKNAWEPFLRYLARLLYRADLSSTIDFIGKELITFNLTNSERRIVRNRMSEIPSQVDLINGTDSLRILGTKRDMALTLAEDESLEQYFGLRIRQRLARQRPHQVIGIWHTAQRVYALMAKDGMRKGEIPSALYAKFVDAFSSMNRPDAADEVWNHMVASGVKPSAEHWVALIKGRRRDHRAVDQIFHRMLNSGTEPDVAVWTSRIHSLLTYGRTAGQGLFALEEMGRAWLLAVNTKYGKNKPELNTIGDLPGAPKPNVATLNAAITALATRRRQDHGLFPRIFAWATQFGIQPNERTYNALIKVCLSDNNMREAMKVLGRMETKGVQPDAATFALFINHIFTQGQQLGDLIDMTKQEQMLSSILRVLDEGGMAADAHTMSILFDILVKQHNNLPAAQRVLDYMADRGMKPSPHIYTILVTHHFQRAGDPDGSGSPDFPAIEALWNHIQSSGGSVDNVFYDRMIEGFAAAGEIGQAMTFLGRMGKEGMKPSWQALCMLAQALVNTGQLDRLREIVDDVENFHGSLKGGPRGYNSWGDKFWEIANACGVRSLRTAEAAEKEGESAAKTA